MFWLYLLAALIFGVQAHKSTASKEFFTINEIEGIVEKRCLKNANASAYSELWDAVSNFYICSFHNVHRPRIHDDNVKHVTCTEVQQNGYNCLKNLLEKAEPCLDLEEMYLLDFVLDVHNRSFEEECRDDFRSSSAKTQPNSPSKCVPPNLRLQNELVETCLPRVEILKKMRNSDYIVRKSELCSNLETAKECAIDGVRFQCKNDEKMIEFVSGFFDQYLYFCNNNDTSASLPN